MQHQSKFSRQITAVAMAALTIGAAIGAGATTALYVRSSSDLSAKLANASARVNVLESLLQVASDSPAASTFDPLPTPLPAAVAPASFDSFASPSQPHQESLPAPSEPNPALEIAKKAAEAEERAQREAAAKAQREAVELAARKKAEETAARKRAEDEARRRKGEEEARRLALAAKTPPAPPKPALPPAPAAAAPQVAVPAPQTQPTSAVDPDEVARATVKNPVVGVNADKLGVAKLVANGVQLRSGTVIKVGDRFGSGERLLSVDPANNRIVTSDRQVLVFFGS